MKQVASALLSVTARAGDWRRLLLSIPSSRVTTKGMRVRGMLALMTLVALVPAATGDYL